MQNILKPSGFVIAGTCSPGAKCRDVDYGAISMIKQWEFRTFQGT